MAGVRTGPRPPPRSSSWLTKQPIAACLRETAQGGNFTITFERENPLQLLRIALPASMGLYPEVSGSHHRCKVNFLP